MPREAVTGFHLLTVTPLPLQFFTTRLANNASIADLFGGVRSYGLLGLVWFDSDKHRDWLVSGPATVAAFHRGARSFTPSLAGEQP